MTSLSRGARPTLRLSLWERRWCEVHVDSDGQVVGAPQRDGVAYPVARVGGRLRLRRRHDAARLCALKRPSHRAKEDKVDRHRAARPRARASRAEARVRLCGVLDKPAAITRGAAKAQLSARANRRERRLGGAAAARRRAAA